MALKFVPLLIFISVLVTAGGISAIKFDEGIGPDCSTLNPSGVYVAISSEAEFGANNSTLRWMEIYWYGVLNEPDDYVGLWDHDPTTDITDVVETAPAQGADGGVRLTARWDGSSFPSTIENNLDCLPYWAAYIQNGTILYSSCLSVHPRWMMENREQIFSMGIAELLLPGCHDAGAYYGIDASVSGDGEIGRWTYAQDESLWQQMVLGVRYVDMRISYYENTLAKFFVNHGDVLVRPLVDYLNQTADFIATTQEIIIFDIHSLEHGLADNEAAKIELINLITSWFETWMAPSALGPNPTIGQLWTLDKRIIVTFPQQSASELIWNNVYHLWGDVNDLNDLYNYMSTNIPIQSGRGSMWSSMSEFTPSTLDVTLNHWGGLRGAAKITNLPVTLWLRREWWTMANIISMDFVASSDVINVVIEGNQQRYACNVTIQLNV